MNGRDRLTGARQDRSSSDPGDSFDSSRRPLDSLCRDLMHPQHVVRHGRKARESWARVSPRPGGGCRSRHPVRPRAQFRPKQQSSSFLHPWPSHTRPEPSEALPTWVRAALLAGRHMAVRADRIESCKCQRLPCSPRKSHSLIGRLTVTPSGGRGSRPSGRFWRHPAWARA